MTSNADRDQLAQPSDSVQGFTMRADRSVDVELPGGLRRRVFFDESNEVTHIWLIPRGGKQTERNVRPGTKAWDAAVEAARAADALSADSLPATQTAQEPKTIKKPGCG